MRRRTTPKRDLVTPVAQTTPSALGVSRKRRGDNPARFPVVGLGASAGGLEALEAFFGQVPPDSGMAYVVVTHQAPGRTSLLPDLLARHSKLDVRAAEDGMNIEPNHVYVSPPGGCLTISNEMLTVHPVDELKRTLPVDHFFRSLAKNDGENAIGIVLSGNGSDGTLGIREIKGNAGMVMAQEPTSARHAGMPSSAIATQLVDFVSPPHEMPSLLERYVRGKSARSNIATEDHIEPDVSGLQRVLLSLRRQTGSDFTAYKKSTVRRRVERRMTVHGIESIREYARLVEQSPVEVEALFKELLISVTSFFRDPEVFAAIDSALRPIIELKDDDASLRVWVPGCATGEEAYSVAILVKEVAFSANKNLQIQIFATDLDPRAIEIARAGRYPEGIAADIDPERLERFFKREEHGYRINKEIRELLIFAPQNLVDDPPFTRLDMVSCRNLLIYLETELQRRVLWLFAYSLRPSGLLVLGTSESVTGLDDVFTIVDKKWKVFQKRDDATARVQDRLPDMPAPAPPWRSTNTARSGARPATVSSIAERMLLAKFVPPTVLVTERGELLYLHGRTGPFLEPPPGEPNNNVYNMAREGLRLELPAAVRQASISDEPVVRRGLQVKTNGGFSSVRLTVQKLSEPESLNGAFVATFQEEPEDVVPAKAVRGRDKKKELQRITSLETELQRSRENLQGMIEELETSNEELKSTNEELQSTNEELQSANEELETSREEMQSLNEELHTVNSELEERNESLSTASDDMQNLLNSTEIATVFLDDTLAIKRFTTQAKRVFSLIETDIGRPISDLTANLRYEGLVEDAREVLRSLLFREREIQTREGAWRLMRIIPYRRHDNLIDGLVITFVDIDRVKKAEEEAQAARSYAESIVEAVNVPLLVLDEGFRILSANRSFFEMFRAPPRTVIGQPIGELLEKRWNSPDLLGALKTVFAENRELDREAFHFSQPIPGGAEVRFSARRLNNHPGRGTMLLLAIEGESKGSDSHQAEGT